MRKLICCVGLPGSGKSTWAVDTINIERSHVRVNKDLIREELKSSGWVWSQAAEKDVIAERDRLINMYFEGGYQVVISDDTNLAPVHRRRLKELADQNNAEFELRVFDTPIDECVRRDSLRTGSAQVGSAVIERMNRAYPTWRQEVGAVPIDYSEFAKWTADSALPPAIICDLDGTLALFDHHRGPFETHKCADDKLNTVVADVITEMWTAGWEVLFVSGREGKFRRPTLQFLQQNTEFDGSNCKLWMRPTGDFRKDWIIKGEIFDIHIRGKYNIKLVLDDRNQIVNFWRYLGLTCWQVAEGDF
jgi:predicted kinase